MHGGTMQSLKVLIVSPIHVGETIASSWICDIFGCEKCLETSKKLAYY
jgi:hypothetical protein